MQQALTRAKEWGNKLLQNFIFRKFFDLCIAQQCEVDKPAQVNSLQKIKDDQKIRVFSETLQR